MALAHPSPDHALAQLAASTAELRRAVEAGDYPAAENALRRRQIEIEALRVAVESRSLSPRQLEQLAESIQQGAEAVRMLASQRAAARAQLADLEAARRRLAAWAPKQPEPAGGLDLRA